MSALGPELILLNLYQKYFLPLTKLSHSADSERIASLLEVVSF